MKRFGYIAFAGIFTVLCMLSVSVPSASLGDVIKLNFANIFPPTHKVSLIWEQWNKDLEKKTDGRIKITYLPGGTLVPSAQSYEAAVRGIADISWSSQQWSAGRFPLTEVIYLPLGAKNATQGTYLINEWYKKFKPKEYEDAKILYLGTAPPGVFMTLKPIESINDLKGMKIRAAGDTTKIAEAMGAVPVSVPIGDIYDGLQRGVIEGTIFPAEALKGWRFGDLIRGLQENPGMSYLSANICIMNKRKWESLPPDIQKIIDDQVAEYIPKHGATWDEITDEGIKFGLEKGMKIIKVSEVEVKMTKQKMQPVLDSYVKRMKDLGLPGEESLKFCQDFIQNYRD